MAYLTKEQVNVWLAETKLQVSAIDADLDTAVADAGLAVLSVRYATSTWADGASTPELVVQALSMLYASWYLQRQIGADDDALDETSYPIRLEKRAMAVLQGILDRTIEIDVDPDPTLAAIDQPLFFPTDSSTQLSVDDPTDPDGSPRVFAMNQRF